MGAAFVSNVSLLKTTGICVTVLLLVEPGWCWEIVVGVKTGTSALVECKHDLRIDHRPLR